MMRRRLGNKDIHLDANSLRVLWKGDTGSGSYYPQYVPCVKGIIVPSTQVLVLASSGSIFGPRLGATGETYAGGWFMTPAGYTGTITMTPVILITATLSGNLRMKGMYGLYVPDTALSFTQGTETTIAANATATLQVLSSIALNMTVSTAQTRISLMMYRNGDDGADTYADFVTADGFMLSYG